LIALIGLVAMIIPAYLVLSKLPVFNKATRTVEGVNETSMSSQDKWLKLVVIVLTALLAAYYLPHFMDRDGELMTIADGLYYVIAGAVFFTILLWVAAAFKDDHERLIQKAKSVTLGTTVLILVALAYRYVLVHTSILTEPVYWSAPSINTIVYWAIVSGGLILMVTLITTPILNAGKDLKNPYGLHISWLQLLASLLKALVLVFGCLLLVALVEWIFLTDFRFYTYAIKIFNSHQFVAALRYMPLFFIYYFAAGMSVYVNTKHMKSIQGDILAAFLLAGPVVMFLIYQYYLLYQTGVAPYPSFSLSAILSVGLVPTLVFAAIIMRRMAIKDQHIWTGVFFSTIFFTFVALANTAVYVITLS